MRSIKNLNRLILTLLFCSVAHSLPYSNGNSGSDHSASAKVNNLLRSDGHRSSLVSGFNQQSNLKTNDNVYINNGDGTITMLNNVQPLSPFNSGVSNTHAEKRNIDNQRIGINEVFDSRTHNNNVNDNNISDDRKVVPTLSTIDQNGRTTPFSSSSTINSNINSITGLDREAIIFPDSLPKQTPKDSYGNPVTPYSVLPDEPTTRPTNSVAVNVGHRTDVNRDMGVSGIDRPKEVTVKNEKDNFAFILPSYASGIMKLETYSDGHVPVRVSDIQKPPTDLLPPLSSGNFNYPEIYKDSTKKPTQTISSNQNIDRVDTQVRINPPRDALVPPPAQPAINFNFNQDRKTTITPRPTNYQAPLVAPTIPQFVKPPNQQPQQTYYQTTQNQPQAVPTLSSQFLQPPRPGSPPNFQSQQQPSQIPQQIPTQATFLQPPKQSPAQVFQPSQQNTGKYTGGFGGAPGFLTPYNKPIVPPPTQLTSAPTIPSTTTYSSTYPSTSSQLPQTTSVQVSSRFAEEAAPINSKDKYVGGFGGPPGILSPFDARQPV